jgi:RNA polymerase sigma-70 factor (ECF subfamily)
MNTPVSLLERLRCRPVEADWQRLDQLYRPLIRHWLRRDPTLDQEAEDLVQEVMAVLVRELPRFDRQRTGSFRCWLRTVTLHRLKAFWRSRQARPAPLGDGSAASPLAQLEDPSSALSRQWDREHDQHVMYRLLEAIQADFAPSTWQAFHQLTFEGRAPEEVGKNLGLSANAVLIAKCRVLKRLRQEGQEFFD